MEMAKPKLTLEVFQMQDSERINKTYTCILRGGCDRSSAIKKPHTIPVWGENPTARQLGRA
jgi:hypothetical protein